MKANWKTILSLTVILVTALLGARELFLSGFYESHDGIIHVMRLAHFDEALKQGQFPVRWLTTWSAGYGSPVFNYIWPLPYYLGILLHWFGLSYQGAVEIMLIGGYVLSGLMMFGFLGELVKSRLAAFLGVVLYMWAPYRFIDIYIRGALGEASAFVFLPLILWIPLRAVKQRKLIPLWFGIVWALFILTHNIMAVIGVVIFLGYLGILGAIRVKKKLWRFWASGLLAFGIGLVLSAFYWLPAVVEADLVRVKDYLTSSYGNHFVSFSALINSAWKYANSWPANQVHSMSFRLGFVHIAVLIASVIFLLIAIMRRKMRSKANGLLYTYYLIVTVLSVFLATKASRVIFDHFIYFGLVNFPWRFLAITVFGIACLAALTVNLLPRFKAVMVILLVGASIYLYWPFSRIASYEFTASDKEYRQMVKTNVGFLPDNEFLPKNSTYPRLFEDRGEAKKYSFFEVLNYSTVSFGTFKKHKLKYTTTITATQPVQIRALQFNYPGWKAFLGGRQVDILTDQYGLINFEVPAGFHQIELVFTDTLIRQIANWLSLVGGLGLVVYYLGKRVIVKIKE